MGALKGLLGGFSIRFKKGFSDKGLKIQMASEFGILGLAFLRNPRNSKFPLKEP